MDARAQVAVGAALVFTGTLLQAASAGAQEFGAHQSRPAGIAVIDRAAYQRVYEGCADARRDGIVLTVRDVSSGALVHREVQSPRQHIVKVTLTTYRDAFPNVYLSGYRRGSTVWVRPKDWASAASTAALRWLGRSRAAYVRGEASEIQQDYEGGNRVVEPLSLCRRLLPAPSTVDWSMSSTTPTATGSVLRLMTAGGSSWGPIVVTVDRGRVVRLLNVDEMDRANVYSVRYTSVHLTVPTDRQVVTHRRWELAKSCYRVPSLVRRFFRQNFQLDPSGPVGSMSAARAMTRSVGRSLALHAPPWTTRVTATPHGARLEIARRYGPRVIYRVTWRAGVATLARVA